MESVEIESLWYTIYSKYRRGWVPAKMLELNRFSEENDFDWQCIRSKHCNGLFCPDGHKRCSNCLGRL